MNYDLILTGATLITCDPAGRVIRDGAIAITGDRLAFVGPASELSADATATRTLDLDGRVITPGLVNVHTHAILSMVRGVAEDLGFAQNHGIESGSDIEGMLDGAFFLVHVDAGREIQSFVVVPFQPLR